MNFNGTTSSTEPALRNANEVEIPNDFVNIGLIVAILSIALFLVSPILIVWICTRCCTGDDSSSDDSSGIESEHIHYSRKRFIRKRICDFKMVVKEEHLVEDDDLETSSESSAGTSDAAEGPHLCLPSSHTSVGDSNGMDGAVRKMRNLCSICLSGYSVGETVVWSSNPDCPHGYHEECLVEWFLKQGRKETICPYCRRQFLEPDPHRITVSEGGESSPSTVSPSPPPTSALPTGEEGESV